MASIDLSSNGGRMLMLTTSRSKPFVSLYYSGPRHGWDSYRPWRLSTWLPTGPREA